MVVRSRLYEELQDCRPNSVSQVCWPCQSFAPMHEDFLACEFSANVFAVNFVEPTQRPSIPANQVDSAYRAGSLLALVWYGSFKPGLGTVCELVAVWKAFDWFCRRHQGKVAGAARCGCVGLFMTARATASLARAGIEPEELVVHHTAIAVENLQMKQTIGRDLHVERPVGSQRNRTHNPRMGSAVVFPAIRGPVLLRFVSADERHTLYYA